MPAHFRLEQAEQLLPELEGALRQAIATKQSYDEVEGKLRSASQRIMLLGGALIDRDHLLELRNSQGMLSTGLREAIETIEERGCVVKDLNTGLIDFPTLYRGAEVYLCWKLGEPGIRFWHRVEDGFRGRKEIDRDFLDNHRGGD